MKPQSPYQQKSNASQDVLKRFTNRETPRKIFNSYLIASAAELGRVLVFYGVGGIGKTTLQLKLCEELKENDVGDGPPTPYARYDFVAGSDSINAHRNVLLSLRSDLERDFKIRFPRFDLCWAVIDAIDGGRPEPIAQSRMPDTLKSMLTFAVNLIGPVSNAKEFIDNAICGLPDEIEERVRRVFKTDDVMYLRRLALQYDESLRDELIRLFAMDLAQGLSERENRAHRGVLFLDTYERQWIGRESGASAQARMVDEWVRILASYCVRPDVSVLLVISGRDHLIWDTDDEEWNDMPDHHLLGGLSIQDAQHFLSMCELGIAPEDGEPTTLQEAIIRCCNTKHSDSSSDISCHP